MELPVPDAGLEDRPGAGLRQHGRAQAGRDHSPDRAAVRRDLPAGRPAARRGQHPHRRRRDRAGDRLPRGRRQGRVHRLDRRRPGDRQGRGRARRRRSPSSSAARPPTSSSTTPRSTRPSRASSTASSSTRATSAARARGCWCRSRWPTRCSSGSSAGWRRCASATRSTRTPTSARSTPPSSSPRSASSPTSARPRAPAAGRRRATCPTTASGSRRRSSPASRQAHRIAREEIFGPVLSVLTFRTPKEAVEKANNTPYGLSAGIWTDKGSRILWMAGAAARRRGVVQHVQPLRPGQPVRRLQGVGLRPRGRPPRTGGLPASELAIDVRKTYKLYIGGAFPRSESGRSYVVNDAKGKFWANASHASRKDARDAVKAARSAFGGWSGADGVQPRPGGLPDRRGARGPARPVRGRAAHRRGHHRRPRHAPTSTPRSTGWSGTPGGPTRSPRSSAAPTRSRGRTSTTPPPSRAA